MNPEGNDGAYTNSSPPSQPGAAPSQPSQPPTQPSAQPSVVEEVVTPLGLESAQLIESPELLDSLLTPTQAPQPASSPFLASASRLQLAVNPATPPIVHAPALPVSSSAGPVPPAAPSTTSSASGPSSSAASPPQANESLSRVSLPSLALQPPPASASSVHAPPPSINGTSSITVAQTQQQQQAPPQSRLLHPQFHSNHRLPIMHDPYVALHSQQSRLNWLKLHEYLEGLDIQQQSSHIGGQEDTAKMAALEDDFKRSGSFLLQMSGNHANNNNDSQYKQQQKFRQNMNRFRYYSTQTGPIESPSLVGLEAAALHVQMEDDSGEKWNLVRLLDQKHFWLDVEQPTDVEMKLLASIFYIHPLTTEDIQLESTREKFELFKNYYFICYCSFDQNPESETFMESFNVYILVYSDFILSFHYHALPSVPHVIRRMENLKSYLQVTPHWINYALLDDITDKFLPVIQSVELEVDSIDDLVLVISQAEQADMLRRIANARKRLMNLTRLLSTKSEVLRVLIKRLDAIGSAASNGLATTTTPEQSLWAATIRDTSLYLGDVQDHVITMVQTLQHVDTTLTRAHSNYLAQINIEHSQTSMKANEGMARLTAIASIIVPLNVITGLWGMNVKVPGGDQSDYAWFFGIVGGMMFIVVAELVFLYWTGFLGKNKKQQ